MKAPALVLLAALGACAHAAPEAGVSFRVEANVAEATVLVDDVLVGRAAEWKGGGPGARHLRPGFHRVEVRAPGFYSVYQEIDARDGGAAVVRAQLRPLLD
ncbi:MAG TPA: hypothetical protein VHJ20_05990 [Polyangia bacterium]|nr:hypothetical protein [Polyangia bacterium]